MGPNFSIGQISPKDHHGANFSQCTNKKKGYYPMAFGYIGDI
jgi:hypothetical protein